MQHELEREARESVDKIRARGARKNNQVEFIAVVQLNAFQDQILIVFVSIEFFFFLTFTNKVAEN